MRTLKRYVENPFDDPSISFDELIAFSTDHLQRMIANNPGALWNNRITATNTALLSVETCLTDDQTKLGLRKSRIQTKVTFRSNLPDKIAMINGVVVGKYGPNAPEVTECFPSGRSVFSTCTDDRVENHLQTLINGLTAHQADLGPEVAGDAGGLLSTWLAVYGASNSSTAQKTTAQDAKRNARLNLQLELFKNLLTIGLNFARQPDKVSLYMVQSLLDDHPRRAVERNNAVAA
jgi:hypothetical protein